MAISTNKRPWYIEVFAAFGDGRLPPQFKTQGGPPTDSDAGIELSYKFAGLSAENQALVKPYLTPPGYPGSWVAPVSASAAEPAAGPNLPPANFAGVNSKNGKVIVWWQTIYPGDQATAQSIADSVDNDTWNKLTTLMGRVPISDELETDNGGDGRLDIYLVNLDDTTLGVTMPYSSVLSANSLTPTPEYILINRLLINRPCIGCSADETVGHEIFHTVQFSYTTVNSWTDSRWMYEATAKWSEDYLFPARNDEQVWADQYFSGTAYPLDRHVYEAYIFFFYLSHKYGAAIIPQLFAALATETPQAALDSTIPGGFDSAWSDFAVNTLNSAPYDNFFKWDAMTYSIWPYQSAKTLGAVSVTADDQTFRPVFPDLQRQSIQSYEFDFSPLAGTSDLITLLHPNAGLPSGLHVWLVTIENGQDPQFTEWTDPGSKNFCLSSPDQELERAWIVIANSSSAAVPLPNDIMEASPTCGWSGDATSTSYDVVNEAAITKPIHGTNLRFVPTNVPGRFATISGQLTETVSGVYLPTGEACTPAGSFSQDVGAGNGQLYITTQGPFPVMYAATGSTPSSIGYTLHCHDDLFSIQYGGDWLDTGPSLQSSSDPNILAGNYQISNADSTYTTTYKWHLFPVRN